MVSTGSLEMDILASGLTPVRTLVTLRVNEKNQFLGKVVFLEDVRPSEFRFSEHDTPFPAGRYKWTDFWSMITTHFFIQTAVVQ